MLELVHLILYLKKSLNFFIIVGCRWSLVLQGVHLINCVVLSLLKICVPCMEVIFTSMSTTSTGSLHLKNPCKKCILAEVGTPCLILKIGELVKVEKVMQRLLCCWRSALWLLSSSSVSKDWTQGKNTLSFIDFRLGRNVLVGSRYARFYA